MFISNWCTIAELIQASKIILLEHQITHKPDMEGASGSTDQFCVILYRDALCWPYSLSAESGRVLLKYKWCEQPTGIFQGQQLRHTTQSYLCLILAHRANTMFAKIMKCPELHSLEVRKSSLPSPLPCSLLWKEKYWKVLRGSPDWHLLFDTHLMSCLTTVTKINESSHSCNYHIVDHSIVLDYHGLLFRNIYTMTTV